LPEDEQASKHGGGGRYNAILEFKGEQIKKFDEKEKNEMRKRKKGKEIKKKKYMYEKKRKEKI
jgi:hypothetical protein